MKEQCFFTKFITNGSICNCRKPKLLGVKNIHSFKISIHVPVNVLSGRLIGCKLRVIFVGAQKWLPVFVNYLKPVISGLYSIL